jgi:hypothetical protein
MPTTTTERFRPPASTSVAGPLDRASGEEHRLEAAAAEQNWP